MNIAECKVIVTGGGSGMGREFALSFARGGASVLAVDIDEATVQGTVDGAAGSSGKVVAHVADVSDEAQVTAMIAAAREKLGGLDVLVNNAGIFRDGLLVKPDKETGEIKKMSLKAWNQVIAVDLTGPFLCTREFAASAIQHKTASSVVVNISSVARHGNPGQTNYSAAKAGLVADTRLWSVELARYGIRVGAVAPGFVDTPILRGMRPDVLEGMLKGVPLRRAASTNEIWLAVKFIVECDYFTGRCIDVDGGISM
jgi:3-oxoacyl-[acyl-carrier protein] reductase